MLRVGISLGILAFIPNECLSTRTPTPRKVDLRSDSVTQPSEAMRSAMFNAEVGDDVFGDDPTVNLLERKLSSMFEKESALFFPSGTMSNLAATMSWCGKRGSEMILGASSQMFVKEQGGISQLAGVLPRCLSNNQDGTISLGSIEKSIRQNNIHFPVTELVALEDTHNFCGGRVLPRGYLEAVGALTASQNIKLHLDGARIWNAAVASQLSLPEIVKGTDSVTISLSKGLGAPSGALLLGPKDFIDRARRSRKVLGGGMRQVGILAAAGLQGVSDFESGILVSDHLKAKLLANAMSNISGFSVNVDAVETNIVMVNIDSDGPEPAGVVTMLKEKGILVTALGERSLRLVLHRDILDEDIEIIILAFKNVAINMWSQLGISDFKTREHVNTIENTARVENAVDASIKDIEELLMESVIDNAVVLSQFDPLPRVSISEARAEALRTATDEVEEEDLDILVSTRSWEIEEQKEIESDGIASKGATDEGQEDEVCNYEETVIHGMSLSDDGFCVLLKGVVCERILRVLITPSDYMADGLDRDQVDTPEAITLLQLLQGIDVESTLARDALSVKFAEIESGRQQQYRLQRVMIDNVASSKLFEGKLCGSVTQTGVAQPSTTSTVSIHPFPENFMSPSYAVGQIPIILDDPTDIEQPAYQLQIQRQISNTIKRIDREVTVESAFESIGLALRHNAVIEVRSTLLQDKHFSYSEEELISYFPQLLKSDVPMEEQGLGLGSDHDTRNERERLQRRLDEAVRQGNTLKIESIKKELNFYSNTDGRSTIVLPPPDISLAPMMFT